MVYSEPAIIRGGEMNKELKSKIVKKYGSQFLFSVALGEHESQVSKVIRGRRPLSEVERRKWALALNCKPEEING
jgi:hypothetical protein